MFIAALLTIAKTWQQPKCLSTDKWIKKMWCVCIQSFPAAGSFLRSQFFASDAQTIGVSASASVIPDSNEYS